MAISNLKKQLNYKQMKQTILLLFSLLLFSSHTNAQSEDEGWFKISTKVVNYKAESDKVSVSKKKGDLSKFKLKCIRGTVKLKSIVVTFDDGEEKTFHPKGTGVLTNGASTFSWSLGKEKKVKTIVLSYDSVGNMLLTKRGKVEIWGKKR